MKRPSLLYRSLLFFIVIFFYLSASLRVAVQCFTATTITTPHKRPTQETHPFLLHAEGGARAGSGGYSLLRQPVRWDLDQDPVFEAPTQLNTKYDGTINGNGDDGNAQWWNSRQTTTNTPTTLQNDEQQQEEEVVDLFQRSLDTLDFDRVLRALQKECTTFPARLLVQKASKSSHNSSITDTEDTQQPTAPATQLLADSVVGCQERYGGVKELSWILEGSHGTDQASFRNRLDYKQDMAGQSFPFIGRSSFPLQPLLLEAGTTTVLEGEEIRMVAEMMDGMEDTYRWGLALEEVEDFVYLPLLASSMEVNSTLRELLHTAFDDKDGRLQLNGKTFPTIGRLRALVRSLKGSVLDTLQALLPKLEPKMAVESGGALYSEVSGGRLVIPVDPKYASSIGLVHDQSRSGKTVYVEPHEIVAPTNELRQTESELQAEEARVWRYLTEQILLNRATLEANVDVIAQLDLTAARFALGRKLSAVIPQVQDEGVIRLSNVKHPVLLLRNIPHIVGSDISFGEGINQGLVLTGPNAGGTLPGAFVASILSQTEILFSTSTRKDGDFEVAGASRADGSFGHSNSCRQGNERRRPTTTR